MIKFCDGRILDVQALNVHINAQMNFECELIMQIILVFMVIKDNRNTKLNISEPWK